MRRMLIMLRNDERSDVEHLLSSRASALYAAATDAGGALRLACQLEHDPLIAQAGEGRTLVPLQGLVEVSFGDGPREPAWADVANAVVSALTDDLDLDGSTIAVGTVHELLPAASEDLLLVMGAHRAPALEHDQFCDYWLGTHAPLALSLLDEDGRRRMGYQQFHTDVAATASAAGAGLAASGFDGVLQVGLSTFEDLPHVRVPGFAETILADEANFADQSAEMGGAFMTTLRVRIN